MRLAVLTFALAFTAVLAAFTALDLARHGPTVAGVLGACVVVLFAVALVGALLHPPQ